MIESGGFTEEQIAVPHKDGPSTEIEYRLAWARTYLKGMGLLDNPARGTWVTTDRGKLAVEGEIENLRKAYLARLAEDRKRKEKAATAAGADPELAVDDAGEAEDWREQLVRVLLEMDPAAFEHLAKRLLRAAGFINTSVTGGSGDGGIDGVGVYRLSLVSFPVYFQCKRYKGSVGPEKVRDFRGAMQGRGDKGLLITTGSFTTEAKKEATRDGAPPRVLRRPRLSRGGVASLFGCALQTRHANQRRCCQRRWSSSSAVDCQKATSSSVRGRGVPAAAARR